MKYFLCVCMIVIALALPKQASAARDASFLSPAASTSMGTAVEAVKVEPKNEVDVGETPVSLGRRATFFFVNQTVQPVNIGTVTANGDSNVKAEVMADDCSSQKVIAPSSRCSVTVEVTPTGYGSWTSEILVTHDGAGRIARARVIGRTAGGKSDKQDTGLSISTKDTKPVDFGDVEVGTDKAVRSALMVNDSNETISLLSIDLIAPENGLQRVDQGCAPDMELRMGESCPVTLLWQPQTRGIVSTDLIIRHTGRLGFAVIPIRGKALEPKDGSGSKTVAKGSTTSSTASIGNGDRGSMPPPSLDDVQREMVGTLSGAALSGLEALADDKGDVKTAMKVTGELSLIGTVGARAILFKPDGTTVTASVGDEISIGFDQTAKVTDISPREVKVQIGKERKTLRLTSVRALRERAGSSKQGEGQGKSASSTAATNKTTSSQSAGTSSVELPASK